MDQLVLYSEGIEPELVGGAIADVEIVAIHARQPLIEALVENPALVGAVVHLERLTESWTVFLESAARSFPMLPILLVSPDTSAPCPTGISCVGTESFVADPRWATEALIGGSIARERRRHHRFHWPLRATVGDGSEHHRVSEISAGGAYLEPISPGLKSRKRYSIEIEFGDFKMRTKCQILDPRHMSSSRGAGFGIRFIDLSEGAREFIDNVVHDALVKVLLDPDAKPSVPSLEEDRAILSISDEFLVI